MGQVRGAGRQPPLVFVSLYPNYADSGVDVFSTLPGYTKDDKLLIAVILCVLWQIGRLNDHRLSGR